MGTLDSRNGLHFVFRSEIMLFSTIVLYILPIGGRVFIRATGSCKGHTNLKFPLLSGKSTVKSMVHWFFSNENLMPEDAPRSNAS